MVHGRNIVTEEENKVAAGPLYFDQTLDHFAPNNEEVVYFQQRYYVNDTFRTSGGPAFLIIGGESALQSTSVIRGAVVEMAAKYGATLFALEHRFYGVSSPFPSLNGATLPYLNTQQALADLANFREAMISQYNLTQNTKWVVFGCSYPGALSAWFRAKFPNLAVASLSTSSPVEAVLDFYQYDQYVANSLGEQCADPIRNATLQMQELLLNPDTNVEIRQRLGCSDVNDSVAVLYVLADLVAYVVQYNYGIQQMCSNFTTSTNLVDTYVTFANNILTSLNKPCIAFDISSFTNETVDPSGMMRQWMWQSCDELGYFQTAPSENSLRSPLITAEWHLQVCRTLFSNATYGPKIAWTNSFYGGNNSLATSNTVFANGKLDPWQALSVTSDLSPSVPSILIANEAHCANWYASSPNDPPALVEARAQVSSYIGAFLGSCGSGCGANGVCTYSRTGNNVTANCAYVNGNHGSDGEKGNGVPWWSLLIVGLGLLAICIIAVIVSIRVTKSRFYSRV
jgi:serine protease 16